MTLRFVLSLFIFPLVVACSGPKASSAALPDARCRAAGAQAELGKTVSDEVADDARAAAGALRARVIRPGERVTMDMDAQRLNIEVDDTGRIRRLRCG